MEKYLVFDIGNSETDWGIFQNDRIIQKGYIDNFKIRENVPFKLLEIISKRHKINKGLIGSVNPKVTRIISQNCKRKGLFPVLLVKSERQKLIKVKYSPISSVGIDRLANVVAAESKYASPLVVVDFGSAITFNVVNLKREFVGGAIAIGIQMANSALHEKTALLPEISLNEKQINKVQIIGKSTRESLRSGLIQGFGAMVDGLVGRIQKELKVKKLMVIATGGTAHLIKPYAKSIQKIDVDLTLRGIYLIEKSIYG